MRPIAGCWRRRGGRGWGRGGGARWVGGGWRARRLWGEGGGAAAAAVVALWGAVGVGVIRIAMVAMSLWFAARSISLIGVNTIPQTLGAASLASVIGFMAIFAPAGLGVHEAVYLLALKPMMGAAVAILAIMFRAMQVLLDVVVAGIWGGGDREEGREKEPKEKGGKNKRKERGLFSKKRS